MKVKMSSLSVWKVSWDGWGGQRWVIDVKDGPYMLFCAMEKEVREHYRL